MSVPCGRRSLGVRRLGLRPEIDAALQAGVQADLDAEVGVGAVGDGLVAGLGGRVR